jgi:hypothetical protein
MDRVREAGGEGVKRMPAPPMRLHLLAPEVKCPACGAGLMFVKPRGHGDLYQCGLFKHQVLHTLNRAARSCGDAPISPYGVFDKWTACGETAAKG